MRALSPPEYARVLPLVPAAARAGHMAFVHAVLEGTQPGAIVVPDGPAPAWALACNYSGFGFALGQPPADPRRAVQFVLEEHLTDEPTFLWAVTPAWREALLPLFAQSRDRLEFHAPASPPPIPALPAGFALRPLDAPLIASWDDGLDPWVIRTWGGEGRFLREAMGWGIEHDGRIVAFCCACAVGGPAAEREAEIEVGTHPDYRGRGLATITGARFMATAMEHGLVPAWTCDAANEPSERTALRLGYRPARQVTGFPLDRRLVFEDGCWRLPV